LIETHDSDDSALPDSAEWRITEEGEAFLNGRTSVWEHVFVLNDAVVGNSDELVFARDVFRPFGWSRWDAAGADVAEKGFEEVVEKARQDLRFAELVEPLHADEFSPMFQFRAEVLDMRRKREGVDVGMENVGAEKGVGFDSRFAP
jgi:hypothetical protein